MDISGFLALAALIILFFGGIFLVSYMLNTTLREELVKTKRALAQAEVNIISLKESNKSLAQIAESYHCSLQETMQMVRDMQVLFNKACDQRDQWQSHYKEASRLCREALNIINKEI